jgi:hypothetical protein
VLYDLAKEDESVGVKARKALAQNISKLSPAQSYDVARLLLMKGFSELFEKPVSGLLDNTVTVKKFLDRLSEANQRAQLRELVITIAMRSLRHCLCLGIAFAKTNLISRTQRLTS